MNDRSSFSLYHDDHKTKEQRTWILFLATNTNKKIHRSGVHFFLFNSFDLGSSEIKFPNRMIHYEIITSSQILLFLFFSLQWCFLSIRSSQLWMNDVDRRIRRNALARRHSKTDMTHRYARSFLPSILFLCEMRWNNIRPSLIKKKEQITFVDITWQMKSKIIIVFAGISNTSFLSRFLSSSNKV